MIVCCFDCDAFSPEGKLFRIQNYVTLFETDFQPFWGHIGSCIFLNMSSYHFHLYLQAQYFASICQLLVNISNFSFTSQLKKRP